MTDVRYIHLYFHNNPTLSQSAQHDITILSTHGKLSELYDTKLQTGIRIIED